MPSAGAFQTLCGETMRAKAQHPFLSTLFRKRGAKNIPMKWLMEALGVQSPQQTPSVSLSLSLDVSLSLCLSLSLSFSLFPSTCDDAGRARVDQPT
jgi:hypothetical protein